MEKIRVWIYCRVAIRGVAKTAMKEQEGLLRQALDPEKHQLVGIFCEYASGRTIRPCLEKLLEEAWQGGMDQLWVTRPDRISRDSWLTAKWVDEMASYGVTVCERNSEGQMVDLSPITRVFSYMRAGTKEQAQYDAEEGGSDMTEQQEGNTLSFQ